MTPNPKAFAAEWIAAWNAHDLDRILSHYAPGIVFDSPNIMRRGFAADGRLVGHEGLRPYWSRAFAERPNLTFTLLSIYEGAGWIALRYTSERGGEVIEAFRFGEDGKVSASTAMYA